MEKGGFQLEPVVVANVLQGNEKWRNGSSVGSGGFSKCFAMFIH